MTTAVTELYDALRKAGVDEASAMGAAKAVSSANLSRLATKLDLKELKGEFKELRGEFKDLRMTTKADMAELKADIIRWNTGTLIAATGIFAAIVKLF